MSVEILAAVKIADMVWNLTSRVRKSSGRLAQNHDQDVFVKNLSNEYWYAFKGTYNVMVMNLQIGDEELKNKAEAHYASVDAFRTTYGIWVFKGGAKFTNVKNCFGLKNWCARAGDGYKVVRYNLMDGKRDQGGNIMCFEQK